MKCIKSCWYEIWEFGRCKGQDKSTFGRPLTALLHLTYKVQLTTISLIDMSVKPHPKDVLHGLDRQHVITFHCSSGLKTYSQTARNRLFF